MMHRSCAAESGDLELGLCHDIGLSGVIYMGRFLRLNSWDLLPPGRLLRVFSALAIRWPTSGASAFRYCSRCSCSSATSHSSAHVAAALDHGNVKFKTNASHFFLNTSISSSPRIFFSVLSPLGSCF